jgi:hypothetical protein
MKNNSLNQMTQGGGLLQLVAMGKQDVFLTGNPQVTWFKMVYRRYTNFSIESSIVLFEPLLSSNEINSSIDAPHNFAISVMRCLNGLVFLFD